MSIIFIKDATNKDSLTRVSHWLKTEQSSFLPLQIKIPIFSRGNMDNVPVKIYTLKYLMVPLTFGLLPHPPRVSAHREDASSSLSDLIWPPRRPVHWRRPVATGPAVCETAHGGGEARG